MSSSIVPLCFPCAGFIGVENVPGRTVVQQCNNFTCRQSTWRSLALLFHLFCTDAHAHAQTKQFTQKQVKSRGKSQSTVSLTLNVHHWHTVLQMCHKAHCNIYLLPALGEG